MIRGKKVFVILALGVFAVGCGSSSSSNSSHPTLVFGTASRAGNYYPLGKSVKSITDSLKEPFNLSVINTKGSVDNILKLKKGEIDIALVQNDVAFYAENGLPPFDSEISNLQGIASFYAEPIYIITNNPSINSLASLRNKNINVGPKKSGLHADAKIILKYSELWESIHRLNHSPDEGLKAVENGKADVAFINVLSESAKTSLRAGRLHLVPVSIATIDRLGKTYPYFSRFETSVSGTRQTTIGVKAILIGRRNLNQQTIYKLTQAINEHVNRIKLPAYNSGLMPSKLVSSMSLSSFHEGALSYYKDQHLLHPQQWTIYISFFLVFIAGFIVLVGAVNFYYISGSNSNYRLLQLNNQVTMFFKRCYNVVADHKYLVVLVMVIAACVGIIVLVKKIEHAWAIEHNVVSNFDNRSFLKSLLWMVIFGGTGYEDQLFPNSPVGKLLVSLIPLIGIGGFLALAGLFTSDHIKKRLLKARGLSSEMLQDHIILCGWNDNVPFLINNLQHDNIVNKKPIILLAETDDEMPLESHDINQELVTFVRGTATRKKDLRRANIQAADVAIVVSDDHTDEPDAQSILKILTIEKYCRQLEEEGKRKGRDNIYTVAEIQDTNNFDPAYDADVDEIISLGHIKSKIFVHSVMNPGVSNLINEVLTYNEYNDFYSIPIDKKSALVGSTFDEILVKLRKKRILLLAISIGSHKHRSELKKLKSKFGLKRSVLTNPIKEQEINYQTHPGDLLIVLADYEETVQSAIKSFKGA